MTTEPGKARPEAAADADVGADEGAPAAPGSTNGNQAAPEADAPGSAAADRLAMLEQRIAELEAEVEEAKEARLRALAEAENARRRAQKDREDASRFGHQPIVRDLMTVADNLRRAIEAAPAESADEAVKALAEGVAMVERELLAAFERHGVKKIEAVGVRFDHDRHQAMFEVETGEHPAGTVVQQLQPGWTLHDRLLRPALVGVAKAPAAGTGNGGGNGGSGDGDPGRVVDQKV